MEDSRRFAQHGSLIGLSQHVLPSPTRSTRSATVLTEAWLILCHGPSAFTASDRKDAAVAKDSSMDRASKILLQRCRPRTLSTACGRCTFEEVKWLGGFLLKKQQRFAGQPMHKQHRGMKSLFCPATTVPLFIYRGSGWSIVRRQLLTAACPTVEWTGFFAQNVIKCGGRDVLQILVNALSKRGKFKGFCRTVGGQ